MNRHYQLVLAIAGCVLLSSMLACSAFESLLTRNATPSTLPSLTLAPSATLTPSATPTRNSTPTEAPTPTATRDPILNVPEEFTSVQAAIEAAEDGDIIVIAQGTYQADESSKYEDVAVILGKSITLRSTNPDDPEIVANTILDGGGKVGVITIEGRENVAEVVISGLTIQNGNSHYGGGISASENAIVTITGNIITDNSTDGQGGGISLNGSSVSAMIRDNLIQNNYADGGGGIAVGLFGVIATISGNTITDNRADGMGGGILIMEGSVTVSGNTFKNNRAKYGGAILTYMLDYIVLNDPEENIFSGNSPDNLSVLMR